MRTKTRTHGLTMLDQVLSLELFGLYESGDVILSAVLVSKYKISVTCMIINQGLCMVIWRSKSTSLPFVVCVGVCGVVLIIVHLVYYPSVTGGF